MNRIREQIAFLAELDQLKSVLRQSPLADRSRRENSAEHSWHLAMCALVLAEHAEGVDVFRAIKLLLIHDIVEIDAGDVPIFSANVDWAAQAQAELDAAKRIFGLLPKFQGMHLLELWMEFEAAATPEARFAKALDRFQPLLLNYLSGGGTWTVNGVSEADVVARYGPIIGGGCPALWEEARMLVSKHFAGLGPYGAPESGSSQ